MIRFFLSMFLFVSLARWLYAETHLIIPTAVPALDYVLEKAQIPTHDKWPKESFQQAFSTVSQLVQDALANSGKLATQVSFAEQQKVVSKTKANAKKSRDREAYGDSSSS